MEIKDINFAKVYHKLLDNLMNNPDYDISPRGIGTKEICDITLKIDNPLECLYTNERRSSQFKYIAAELLWYFKADRDIDYITKYAKFWQHISEDNKVNSAYGDLIFGTKNEYGFTQYQWAYDSLIKDKNTRQAILHFNTPKHQYNNNKDFVCTLDAMFMIRNNKLNFSVSMRSNDAILGLPTDVPFFCTLQSHMLYHLKETYPELELGTYTHKVNSMHVYERHYDLINDMLKYEFVSNEIPKVDTEFVKTSGDYTILTEDLYDYANRYELNDVGDGYFSMEKSNLVDFIVNNLKK